MIENPGPLAEMRGNPASNFYVGRYNVEVLAEDRIYYRGGYDVMQSFIKEPWKLDYKVISSSPPLN